jgi:hypothetical protein
MKNTLLTLVAGLCLLFPPYFAPPPGLTSPFVLLTIPLDVAFSWMGKGYWLERTEILQVVMLVLPALFFFAWNPRLLSGQARTPRRTYILVVLGVAVGIANLVVSWSYGLRFQGFEYTLFAEAESAACIAVLCVLFFRSWRGAPSFGWNLALHWVFFAWLAWFAFPYLGEPI